MRNATLLDLLRDSALLLAMAALALILTLAWWDWHEFQNASARVQETDVALGRIAAVLSNVKDAETGQRGYLLTGLEQYLEPFEHAKSQELGEIVRVAPLHCGRPGSAGHSYRSRFLDRREIR